MKRNKLSVKTSAHGNLEYHVYRGETQEQVPADLTALAAMTAILTAKEDEVQHEAEKIEQLITVDVTKVPMQDLIPYALSFEPLKNNIHFVEFEIIHVNPDSGDAPIPLLRKLLVEFNENGDVDKVLKTENDLVETDVTGLGAIHFLNKTAFVKDDYTENSTEIKATYFMRVINVYDDDIRLQEGVEFEGPVGDGLPTPTLTVMKDMMPKAAETSIPIAYIQASGGVDGLIYYYRVVGKDPLGNLSDPSGLFSTHLVQSADEIEYSLEVSEDGVIWSHLMMMQDLENIEFGSPGTPNYDSYGKFITDEFLAFIINDVIVDKSDVSIENRLSITVPNVWKTDAPLYRTRSTKQFRTKVTDTYGKTSEYSDPTIKEQVIVPVEKIIVMKKIVTSLDLVDQEMPVEMDDEGAEAIKTWIRKNGIYYNPVEHNNLPINVRISSAPYSIFDDSTDFTTISLNDTSVIEGETYSYTIYLLDAFGEASAPLVVRVVC